MKNTTSKYTHFNFFTSKHKILKSTFSSHKKNFALSQKNNGNLTLKTMIT